MPTGMSWITGQCSPCEAEGESNIRREFWVAGGFPSELECPSRQANGRTCRKLAWGQALWKGGRVRGVLTGSLIPLAESATRMPAHAAGRVLDPPES